MKEFTSCFIGVPLPDKYQPEFEALLKELSQIEPQLKTVYPATPHITVFYLDVQSQFNLPAISNVVRSKVDIVKGTELVVGNFGYFRGEEPRVLFLDVKYPEEFKKFNVALDEELTKYFADDNTLPFHPHMTVGGVYTPEAQQAFRQAAEQFKAKLNQIKWTFPISEIILYGVDSTKHPQYQEKLINIPMGL